MYSYITYCILLIYSTYLAVAAKKEKLKMLTCIFLFCFFAKRKIKMLTCILVVLFCGEEVYAINYSLL